MKVWQWGPVRVALVAALVMVGPLLVVLTFAEDEAVQRAGLIDSESSDETVTTTLAEGQPTITDDPHATPARAEVHLSAGTSVRDTPPSTMAAVTSDGRLVIVDTADGQVLSVLDVDGDLPGSSAAGPSRIDGVVISADRSRVWYSVCCQSAAGAMYEVLTDGTRDSVWIGNSGRPSSSGGFRWVISTGFVVRLDDTHDGTVRLWRPNGTAEGVERAALSPDGRQVAALEWPTGDDPSRQRLVLVNTETVIEHDNAIGEIVDPDPTVVPGDRWRFPVFRRDGALVVARQPESGSVWHTYAVDTESFETEPLEEVSYRGVALDHRYDASGEWLLVLIGGSEDSPTGTLRWFGPDATSGTISGEYRAAAW